MSSRPQSQALIRVALALFVWALGGAAQAQAPVAVSAVGPTEPGRIAARDAIREAVTDSGGRVLSAAKAQAALGEPLPAAVRSCGGEPVCLGRIAQRLGTELWIADVQPEWEALTVSVQRIRPDGSSAELGRWTRIDAAEVQGAVYPTVLRALRVKGKGTLTVTPRPADAQVVIAGRPVDTPEGVLVDAGGVLVEVSAPGYTTWRQKVAVRPGKHTAVEAILEPDVAGLPLAGLIPSGPAEVDPDEADLDSEELPLAGVPGPRGSDASAQGDAAADDSAPADPEATDTDTAAADAGPALAAAPEEREVDYQGLTPADAATAGLSGSAPPAAVDVGRSPFSRPEVVGSIGGGALAVAAAAWFGMQAQDTARRARAEEIQLQVQSLNDEAVGQARTANVLYAIGGAALGVGSFLLTADLLSR